MIELYYIVLNEREVRNLNDENKLVVRPYFNFH
jgi:hypothetical protein